MSKNKETQADSVPAPTPDESDLSSMTDTPKKTVESEKTSKSEKPGKAAKTSKPMDVSRRTFCIGAASTAVLFGLGALRFVEHNELCRPPGGQDESHLLSACIRCQKCYEACPRKVIVPAHLEDGFMGTRTPTLNFNNDFCDYCAEEYNGIPQCVEVCPTEALKLPEGATAENVIIGLAVINERECLAFRNTGCRFCYDACPYEAIRLEGGEKNPLPYVIADKCNGCGACESVCVSLQSGSIASGATQRAIVIKPLEASE